MTTESTQPQSELGPAPANEPGQSQGHRRRRRRRKNKPSQAGVAPVQQAQAQTPAAEQSVAAPPAPQRPHKATGASQDSPQDSRQGQRQGARQGQRPQQSAQRKKKKFVPKSAAPAQQPGNSISAPPQNRRKSNSGGGKQRGPREFVGPMDHSYRIANGNVAEGPPSTIQISSQGPSSHGGQYEDSFQPVATVPVREDAPTRIYCFIEDLFFLAKIQETARKLGVKVEFVKGDKETLTRLTEMSETERPALLVFDLNNLNAKPMTLIPKYKAKLKKATSIIGFLNHLQGELKAKAIEVGCDTVMPRSAFSQTLPNLLRRYGLVEEEEYAQQPM